MTLFDDLQQDSGRRFGVRTEGRTLCGQDRELLDIWAEHGIPADLSTIEHACELVLLLWGKLRELEAACYEPVPGEARSYETPCVWINEHGQVDAVLTTSRTEDGWWVSCTPLGWATLWLSSEPAPPWGPWRTQAAACKDAVHPTATAAIEAALATDQIGAAT